MRRSPSRHSEFELPERNAPVDQVPAVGVAIAQRDAEQSWRHQGAVHRNDRERNRQSVVSTHPSNGDAVRDAVKSR